MKSLPNSIRPQPKHFYVPNQLDIVKPIKPTGHNTSYFAEKCTVLTSTISVIKQT